MILASTMNIEGLISDLAFILLLGAIVTVIFKWIKQPVVLGYIVAGFLASPNFEPLPSVTTEANIEFWAQLGIVILLFSLGLEFSFKKLLNVGGSAVVTALIIVIGMMATGFVIGKLLHFTNINSIFLGGMLSMSSTTIIIKAFTDLNLRQKKFASLVFAVLIVEDLFAVVMMVILSSLATGDNLEGGEMLYSVGKLVFFLVIWFLVGVYLLPTIFKKTRGFLNNETLLVISMGLCLGMSVFSVFCGFSLALGAFVMGSILAGTNMAERIEHVTAPVKDLFGAVFFISVGMMVQPSIIAEYWGPILLLSVVVIVGMIVFGTASMLLTGQSLKVAIESGFSLTQIGEFAFIIASLGMSLGVLDETIYPIVVAVSVITTFTTPYFIKMSEPAYKLVERHLPKRLHFLIDRYTEDATKAGSTTSAWVKLLKRYAWRIVLYSIVLLAITIVSQRYFMPFVTDLMPHWGKLVGVVLTLTVMSPFLLALCLSTSKRAEQLELEPYKVPRAVMMLFRIAIALSFIIHFLSSTYSMAVGASTGVALQFHILMLRSTKVRKPMRSIEATFIKNLNERDLSKSGRGNNLIGNLHMASMRVSGACQFVGMPLTKADLHRRFGVNIAAIQRDSHFIPAPSGTDRLFPGDIVSVIGNDDRLQKILPMIEAPDKENGVVVNPTDYRLRDFTIGDNSILVGKTPQQAMLREKFRTLIVAVQRCEEMVDNPGTLTFEPGDHLWVVATHDVVSTLQ